MRHLRGPEWQEGSGAEREKAKGHFPHEPSHEKNEFESTSQKIHIPSQSARAQMPPACSALLYPVQSPHLNSFRATLAQLTHLLPTALRSLQGCQWRRHLQSPGARNVRFEGKTRPPIPNPPFSNLCSWHPPDH